MAIRSRLIVYILLVLLGGSLGGVVGIGLSRSIPPTYSIVLTIAPRSHPPVSVGGAPSFPLEAGGVDGALDVFTVFQEALKGPAMAARVIRERELAAVVLDDRWVLEEGAWHRRSGITSAIEEWLKGLAGSVLPPEPTVDHVYRALGHRVAIRSLGDTALRQLVLVVAERERGIELLSYLHREADGMLRRQAEHRIAAQINHLDERMADLRITEYRDVLITLRVRLEQALLLLVSDQPYAAEIVSGPYAPIHPSWPDPILIVPACAFCGALTATALGRISVVWR